MPRTLPITLHLDAAAMLARDVSVSEVARQMGVSRRTIQTWAKTPECQQHIAAIKAGVREATKHLAIADKVRRVRYAQDMLDGTQAVIHERREAAKSSASPLPGESTGHVAVKTETLSNLVTKREAAFDASIHAEARKWLEYAAKELGDVESGITVRHSGRVDHRHSTLPDFSALTLEEQFQLDQMLAKVTEGPGERG